MRFQATVDVMLKEGISDPQGQTIERALPTLGYASVAGVRVGKHIQLEIDASGPEEARARLEDLCRQLLANPVIESYEVSIR